MATTCVWDDLIGQRRVAGFLERAVASDQVSHAYLFVGPIGAGKQTAARALACALLCDDGGCGHCGVCRRVRNGTHPDVMVTRPAGASSYIVSQVREVVHDVSLRPVEGKAKVYIIHEADRFNAESANAFLKTLEEPPAGVVFVLTAAQMDTVLPTIVSRCQVVRFSPVSSSAALDVLVERSGADPAEVRAALAASDGIVPRALEFLRSPVRRQTRALVLDVLKRLTLMDGHDVLMAARELLTAAKAPVAELKQAQVAELAERRELLGKGVSTTTVEDRYKREVTARERESIIGLMSVTESWLRDCLMLVGGVDELVMNADETDAIQEVAAVITPQALLKALDAVRRARRSISYNVSPQLVVETMLFNIQEVFRCPR